MDRRGVVQLAADNLFKESKVLKKRVHKTRPDGRVIGANAGVGPIMSSKSLFKSHFP